MYIYIIVYINHYDENLLNIFLICCLNHQQCTIDKNIQVNLKDIHHVPYYDFALLRQKVFCKYGRWYWNQNIMVQYQNCIVLLRFMYIIKKIRYGFCVHSYMSLNKNQKIAVSLRLGPYFWANYYFCSIESCWSLCLWCHHRKNHSKYF